MTPLLPKGTIMKLTKQNLKSKAVAIQTHVYSHRARYAALATLAGCTLLQLRNATEWNEFLEKHGLLDEYYYDADADTPPATEN